MSHEVTDAMVKAARVWLTHLRMKRQVDVDNAVRNAIEAALCEAADRARKPDTRRVASGEVMDAIRELIARWRKDADELGDEHFTWRADELEAA